MYVITQDLSKMIEFKGAEIVEEQVGVDTTTYKIELIDSISGSTNGIELGEYSSKDYCLNEMKSIDRYESKGFNLYEMSKYK